MDGWEQKPTLVVGESHGTLPAVTFKIFNNWDSLDCGHSVEAGTWDFPVFPGRPIGEPRYLEAMTKKHFNTADTGRTGDSNPSPKALPEVGSRSSLAHSTSFFGV